MQIIKPMNLLNVSCKLTSLQGKIWDFILKKSGDAPGVYDFAIGLVELKEHLGIRTRNNSWLRRGFLGLSKVVVSWEDGEKTHITHLVTEVTLDRSTCRYTISRLISDALRHPARYYKLDIRLRTRIKSAYGMIFHEIWSAAYNEKIGKTQTRWYSVDELRGMSGVGERYKAWKSFSQFVLLPSLKVSNELSNKFGVEMETKKVGNAIVSVKFWVTRKPRPSRIVQETQLEPEVSVATPKVVSPCWDDSDEPQTASMGELMGGILSKYGIGGVCGG